MKMNVDKIQSFVEKFMHDGFDSEGEELESNKDMGISLITARLGKLAEVRLRLDLLSDDLSEEDRKKVLGDMFAGLVMTVVHAASDEGIDLAAALDKRIEAHAEKFQKQEDMKQAIDDGDFEAIADEIEKQMDAEEAEGDGDDADPRGIQ